MNSYVLITAARNEEKYIEMTIRSVVAQTIPPLKWVIVSDGSTDCTDRIVETYARNNRFIELIKLADEEKRNFGAKARAVTIGYQRVSNLQFNYVGNLDADVGFVPSYYENMMRRMDKDHSLGLGGGIRYDWYNGRFTRVRSATNSVGGPFQLFRRQCFEDIGGYAELEYGGIDAVAEITARMKGWKVQSFPDFQMHHYRCTGTATGGQLHASFRAGIRNYLIGYHPWFYFLKAAKECFSPPFLAGGIARMAGYAWAAFQRMKRPVPDAFIRYLRSEQTARIKSFLSRLHRMNLPVEATSREPATSTMNRQQKP